VFNGLLAGIETSPWSEVAWSASSLTGDGYPVELAFTSTGEAIRYVAEVAGPEMGEHQRLDQALAVLSRLGVWDMPCLPGGQAASILPQLRRLQVAGRLTYGVWVGGRHARLGDTFKLYVEVPDVDSPHLPALVCPFLGNQPLLLHHTVRLRMIGYELNTGRTEFYYRSDRLEPWEVARLMSRVDLTAAMDSLLDLIEDITGSSLARLLPSSQAGFSLSMLPNDGPTVFSLFFFARHILGGDGQIRRRLLAVAARRGWPLQDYEAISRPLAERTGPHTKHGILSFVIASRGSPMVHIGLRPPE
jgi:hypothetical protein